MNENVYSFQVDSTVVIHQRDKNDNYIVEYNNNAINKRQCVIYFSSHDIYYPNDIKAFETSILKKDRFEWRNCKISTAYKHIFLRDVNKQWYLSGINSKISDPEELLQFLKEQTDGYEIITIGSSAGGYAAVLYGMLLDNVVKVYAFSPRFTMHPLINTSELENPLYHRLKDNPKFHKYLDLKPLLLDNKSEKIYYFVGIDSKLDIVQMNHVGDDTRMHIIKFLTSRHGIPFPKASLDKILNMSADELSAFSGRMYSPILFSVKVVGAFKTFHGLFKQTLSLCKKIIKRRVRI